VDDGLFEVVGFRDAWHGLVLLAPNGHGTRLAQVGFMIIPASYFFFLVYNIYDGRALHVIKMLLLLLHYILLFLCFSTLTFINLI